MVTNSKHLQDEIVSSKAGRRPAGEAPGLRTLKYSPPEVGESEKEYKEQRKLVKSP